MYWAVAPVVLATPLSKPIFYDMQHSNNAARIRLWRSLKVGMDDAIERRLLDIPFRSSFKSDPENHHGDYIFKKDPTVATAEFAQEHRCATLITARCF